jgi:hypothetical protein
MLAMVHGGKSRIWQDRGINGTGSATALQTMGKDTMLKIPAKGENPTVVKFRYRHASMPTKTMIIQPQKWDFETQSSRQNGRDYKPIPP